MTPTKVAIKLDNDSPAIKLDNNSPVISPEPSSSASSTPSTPSTPSSVQSSVLSPREDEFLLDEVAISRQFSQPYDKELPPIPTPKRSDASLLSRVGSIRKLDRMLKDLAYPIPPSTTNSKGVTLRGASDAKKKEKKQNGHEQKMMALGSLQDLLVEIPRPPLSPTHKALLEAEEKQRVFEFDLIDTMVGLLKNRQITVEALYFTLDVYEKQNKLKVLIEPVYHSLEKLGDVSEILFQMLHMSAKLTSKSVPFREEYPGLSLFSCHLVQHLKKLLGPLPFATLAFELIKKMVPHLKDPATDERMIMELSKTYLERLALLFLAKVYRKAPDVHKASQAFGSMCAEEKIVVISPQNLLLNVFFLRCLNPELTSVIASLRESKDEHHIMLAGYFLGISKSIAQIANQNEHEKTGSLQLIALSLLSPENVAISEIERLLKTIRI